MRKYKIRENSPVDWLLITIGMLAFLVFMSIPSTIEFL